MRSVYSSELLRVVESTGRNLLQMPSPSQTSVFSASGTATQCSGKSPKRGAAQALLASSNFDTYEAMSRSAYPSLPTHEAPTAAPSPAVEGISPYAESSGGTLTTDDRPSPGDRDDTGTLPSDLPSNSPAAITFIDTLAVQATTLTKELGLGIPKGVLESPFKALRKSVQPFFSLRVLGAFGVLFVAVWFNCVCQIMLDHWYLYGTVFTAPDAKNQYGWDETNPVRFAEQFAAQVRKERLDDVGFYFAEMLTQRDVVLDANGNPVPGTANHVALPGNPDDALAMVAIFTLGFLLLAHPDRAAIFRRHLCFTGALFFLRGLSISSTPLPPPFEWCDWTQSRAGENFALEGLGVMAGQRVTCTDCLFSGHTANFALLALAFFRYLDPEVCPSRAVRGAIKLVFILFVVYGLLVIIDSKFHYTVDVLLGSALTCVVWASYFGAMAKLQTRRKVRTMDAIVISLNRRAAALAKRGRRGEAEEGCAQQQPGAAGTHHDWLASQSPRTQASLLLDASLSVMMPPPTPLDASLSAASAQPTECTTRKESLSFMHARAFAISPTSAPLRAPDVYGEEDDPEKQQWLWQNRRHDFFLVRVIAWFEEEDMLKLESADATRLARLDRAHRAGAERNSAGQVRGDRRRRRDRALSWCRGRPRTTGASLAADADRNSLASSLSVIESAPAAEGDLLGEHLLGETRLELDVDKEERERVGRFRVRRALVVMLGLLLYIGGKFWAQKEGATAHMSAVVKEAKRGHDLEERERRAAARATFAKSGAESNSGSTEATVERKEEAENKTWFLRGL